MATQAWTTSNTAPAGRQPEPVERRCPVGRHEPLGGLVPRSRPELGAERRPPSLQVHATTRRQDVHDRRWVPEDPRRPERPGPGSVNQVVPASGTDRGHDRQGSRRHISGSPTRSRSTPTAAEACARQRVMVIHVKRRRNHLGRALRRSRDGHAAHDGRHGRDHDGRDYRRPSRRSVSCGATRPPARRRSTSPPTPTAPPTGPGVPVRPPSAAGTPQRRWAHQREDRRQRARHRRGQDQPVDWDRSTDRCPRTHRRLRRCRQPGPIASSRASPSTGHGRCSSLTPRQARPTCS